MESAISSLDSFHDMFEMGSSLFEEAYAAAKLPGYTVAQMYKKMDKARAFFEEKLSSAKYDRQWYDPAWN